MNNTLTLSNSNSNNETFLRLSFKELFKDIALIENPKSKKETKFNNYVSRAQEGKLDVNLKELSERRVATGFISKFDQVGKAKDIPNLVYHVLKSSSSQNSKEVNPALIVALIYTQIFKLKENSQTLIINELKKLANEKNFSDLVRHQLAFSSKLDEKTLKEDQNLALAQYFIDTLSSEKNNANPAVYQQVFNCLNGLVCEYTKKDIEPITLKKAVELYEHIVTKVFSTEIPDSIYFNNFIDKCTYNCTEVPENYDYQTYNWNTRSDFLKQLLESPTLPTKQKEFLINTLAKKYDGNKRYFEFFNYILNLGDQFIPTSYIQKAKSLVTLTSSQENQRKAIKEIVASAILKHPKTYSTEEGLTTVKTIFDKGYLNEEKQKQLLSEFIKNADLNNEKVLNFLIYLATTYPKTTAFTIATQLQLKELPKILTNSENSELKQKLLDLVLACTENKTTNEQLVTSYVQNCNIEDEATVKYLKTKPQFAESIATALCTHHKDQLGKQNQLQLKLELFNLILKNQTVTNKTKGELIQHFMSSANLNETEVLNYLKKLTDKNSSIILAVSVSTELLEKYQEKLGDSKSRTQITQLLDNILSRTEKVTIENEEVVEIRPGQKYDLISAFVKNCKEDYASMLNYAKTIIDTNQELRSVLFLDLIYLFSNDIQEVTKITKTRDNNNPIVSFIDNYYNQVKNTKDVTSIMDELRKYYSGASNDTNVFEKELATIIKNLTGDQYKDCLPVKQKSSWF